MPGKWRTLLTRTTVSATVSLIGWRIIGPSPSAQIIREMGNAYSESLAVAMGRNRVDSGAVDRKRMTLQMIMTIDPRFRTRDENIRVLEHELMIAGHEFDCEICIENNMTIHQKAIRRMRQMWGA